MMLRGLASAFLVGSVLFGVAFADESDPGDVVVLTKGNFDSKVRELTGGDSALLVEFYAPWCGHCKSLEVCQVVAHGVNFATLKIIWCRIIASTI